MSNSASQLVEPHGGSIVDRRVTEEAARQLAARAVRLPKILLSERALCDLVCIVTGAYSPLEGFMGQPDYQSTIESMRLSDGTIWPIPIVLPVETETARALKLDGTAALVDSDGGIVATIDVADIYQADQKREVLGVYGTADPAHPGVAAVLDSPQTYVSGKITLIKMPQSEFPEHALTPAQTRARFSELGWRSVVGFQTRNPVHRAHEYLQKVALEVVDGLLLHPLVGKTKDDDVPAEVRMRCYQVLLDNYYPQGRTVLSVFQAAMRYAGPREAVLHAIARKNFGCSHFIVGRDHAGIGTYYGTFDAQRIFDGLEDELGITIMRFEHAFWCNACESMATPKTCPHGDEKHLVLSGTKVRGLLRSGEKPPPEFSRPEVAEILIDAMANSPAAKV